jgi:hypothetical protein
MDVASPYVQMYTGDVCTNTRPARTQKMQPEKYQPILNVPK